MKAVVQRVIKASVAGKHVLPTLIYKRMLGLYFVRLCE